MSLPGSFSLDWLWDLVVLQSAELDVPQVQHGARYRKSDARSEDNRRSQRNEFHAVVLIAFINITKVIVERKALSSGFTASNI